MISRISSEVIEAIIAGCDGVTPGPWWAEPEYDADGCGCSIIAAYTDCGLLPGNPTRGQVAFATQLLPEDAAVAEANAAHIARLSPEVVRAMATKLLELERAAGWQPIETAPRDGTQVLLYAESWSMSWGEVQTGSFEDGMWRTGAGEVEDNGPEADIELSDEEAEDFDFEGDYGPTHWMPLPKSPALTPGDQQ